MTVSITLQILLSFALGTIVGSFLNVVALRYNTGRSLGGRSSCAHCAVQLRWFELVPLVSFLLLRGHCRSCRSTLSLQYPLVELATGILFTFIALQHLWKSDFHSVAEVLPAVLFGWVLWSILVVIVVYDIAHKIIPNALVYSFSTLALLSTFFTDAWVFATPSVLSLLAGPLIALPFLVFWLISRGRWMGLGDAKLALGIGWLLGLSGGVEALAIAFWSGALVGVSLLAAEKIRARLQSATHSGALLTSAARITMKSELPFAPFLVLGLAAVLLLNIHVLEYVFP